MVKVFLRAQPSSEGVFHLDREFKKRLTKVMRLKSGDPLHVFTPGKRFECSVSRILPESIELLVIQELSPPATARIHLSLGQAIPKGEKFDWLIQKATELGVAEIFPLITERTIVHPANLDAKLQRWNEIADHAAAQSENPDPTLIHIPDTMPHFLAQPHPGLKVFLHERDQSVPLRQLLQQHHNEHHITFVVGPEGGWSSEETAALEKAGFIKIHLGLRILRSETAGLVLASVLQYEFGDFR